MKRLIDFDYDLWITEEGKYMVRVRRTGKECEVDRGIFRLLRAEEKRLRRERTPEKKDGIPDKAIGHPLSLDIIDTDSDGSFWHIDPRNLIEESILDQTVEQFRSRLTARQLDVFEKCLLGGMALTEYARLEKLNYRAVWEVREAIRRKFTQL